MFNVKIELKDNVLKMMNTVFMHSYITLNFSSLLKNVK